MVTHFLGFSCSLASCIVAFTFKIANLSNCYLSSSGKYIFICLMSFTFFNLIWTYLLLVCYCLWHNLNFYVFPGSYNSPIWLLEMFLSLRRWLYSSSLWFLPCIDPGPVNDLTSCQPELAVSYSSNCKHT